MARRQSTAPLSFLHTRTYPIYQFYMTMEIPGQSAEKCFLYAGLTTYEWLRKKATHDYPPEFDTPPANEYLTADLSVLKSVHINEGYTLDITSLPADGMWALKIREPESNNSDREPVVGRTIVTNIAFRIIDDTKVECGILIESVDPEYCEEELRRGFRPAIVRTMLLNPAVQASNEHPILYDRPTVVRTSSQLNDLCNLITNRDNCQPITIFSYASEKRDLISIVAHLDAELGLAGKEKSIESLIAEMDFPPEVDIGAVTMPYDVTAYKKHTAGYGWTFVIDSGMMVEYQARMHDTVKPGDILWIEPRRFGGESKRFPYLDVEHKWQKDNILDELQKLTYEYSKGKSVPFGSIKFEPELRGIERDKRIDEIKKASEKSVDDLFDSQNEKIQELEATIKRLEQEKAYYETENNRLYEEKYNSAGHVAGIKVDGIQELYDGELHDLIISALMYVKSKHCDEGSRKEELIEELLAQNELQGKGKKFFDGLKKILYQDRNLTESDYSELRELGFEVTKTKGGHYKIVFLNDKKRQSILPATGSDHRGLKNAYSEIVNKESVY